MVIQDNDILHTNAAVVAGILVLFTFTTLVEEGAELAYKGWIVATITPFAGSSIMLLVPTKPAKSLPSKTTIWAGINRRIIGNPRFWTSIGFCFLLITILFLQYGGVNSPDQPSVGLEPTVDLQRAISIAENLNATKEYRKSVTGYDIQITAMYLTAGQTEAYRQSQGETSVPANEPTLLIAYFVKLDVENSAVLRVFIDPETYVVYGWFQYATQFG